MTVGSTLIKKCITLNNHMHGSFRLKNIYSISILFHFASPFQRTHFNKTFCVAWLEEIFSQNQLRLLLKLLFKI